MCVECYYYVWEGQFLYYSTSNDVLAFLTLSDWIVVAAYVSNLIDYPLFDKMTR